MKRFLLSALGLVVIAGGLFVARGKRDLGHVVEKDVIKVGIILPLTDNNALIGVQAKEGIDFIKESQNYDFDYEIIFEDDQMQQTKTVFR